ncbi:MD-2-related lipid-recognition domain-containing protein, partial [Catenaria anguillulae PL171]
SLSDVKQCAKNSDADALDLESLELIPDQPKRGEPLQVRLKGQLRRTIDRPATVHVLVKLGRFIQLLKQDLDLCNEVGRVDLTCPLQQGPIVIDKKFDLPNEIPPGTYYVTADITDQEGGPVTCVQVAVKF